MTRTAWTLSLALVFGATSGCDPAGKDGPAPADTGAATDPVDEDEDGAPAGVDCDDADPTRFPGAAERCDGIDNDCDREIDDAPIDGVAGYADVDRDGYGASPALIVACARSPSLVDNGDDCDDADPTIHPGADERCDGLDSDCDPATGEAGLVLLGAAGFTDLESAVAASSPGDTVWVCDGVYPTAVQIPHDLTLASRNGPDVTELIGDGGPVIRARGVALTLRGFTVRGGAGGADLGGGVSAQESEVTVEDCTFTDNDADSGAAIRVDIGSVTVRDSTIDANRSAVGGAVYASFATLTVQDSTFDANPGGALEVDRSAATVAASTFTGNEASSGGAISTSGALTVADSTFTANEAISGGAVYAAQRTTVTDTTFEDNAAGIGGALFHYGGDLTLERAVFVRNEATSSGGAVGLDGDAVVAVVDTTVTENRAPRGGGLDITQSDGATIVSTGSDWGTGATDNQDDDVASVIRTYRFGAEDFSCTEQRCE